jgi:galactose mutarotase-like enzyme
MSELLKTIWHSFPALALESESMRLVIVPGLGAKIVSLCDKLHGREWLVPPMRPVKRTVYGADFVSQDMSGWDEMLPTVIACDWEGAHLPDHGEIWSIPWQLESAGDAVVLSVEGIAMSYQLTRRAAVSAPNCLELQYTLTNSGKTAFPYLWAAHPQFIVDSNTRIVLPPKVTQVVNVIDPDPIWGKAGELYDWPKATSTDGQTWCLDRVGPAENHTCRKFYIPPDQPVAWAALVDESRGCGLYLEWAPSAVPYLGLWIDEGMYNSAAVAALEPSNGYYDSLENAIQHKRVNVLEPEKGQSWTMRIRIGGVNDFPGDYGKDL